jgi:hypothetical protein
MRFTRRTALRGMLGGGLVSVALPFLDCFLDVNGTALAATGGRSSRSASAPGSGAAD